MSTDPVDPRALSEEQASVLACLQAGLDVNGIEAWTGLAPERIAVVVQDLIALSVVQPVAPEEPWPGAREAPPAFEAEPPESLPDGIEAWSGQDMPEGSAASDAPLPEGDAAGEDATSATDAADGSGAGGGTELDYRRHYESRFRDLELSLRVASAEHADSHTLAALCFDPAPQVIAAAMTNLHFGLAHARLAAVHHPNARGLEILARRADVVRDSQVQRRLLQNQQTPESVLERIIRVRRLLDVYRLSVDRDLPERNRTRVRARLRPCFHHADPDERAALIIKTEGRCLVALSGCTFDGRTTQILCNQSAFSTLFVQNLARFPATPGVLIAKLLRLPTVQRQPQLRQLLFRHPSASAEMKRRG